MTRVWAYIAHLVRHEIRLRPVALGYNGGREATIVSYGPNASAKYITTYFRRHFAVADPSVFSTLTVFVQRDDGAVVYLNGQEVWRYNMPVGNIDFTTLAAINIGGGAENAWNEQNFSATLQPGNNTLAVEIHQAAAISSDVSFNFELLALQTLRAASMLPFSKFSRTFDTKFLSVLFAFLIVIYLSIKT